MYSTEIMEKCSFQDPETGYLQCANNWLTGSKSPPAQQPVNLWGIWGERSVVGDARVEQAPIRRGFKM